MCLHIGEVGMSYLLLLELLLEFLSLFLQGTVFLL